MFMLEKKVTDFIIEGNTLKGLLPLIMKYS